MFSAVGVAPINFKLLCYSRAISLFEQRKCAICENDIESECHVLAQCLLYDNIRERLLHHLYRHVAQFNEISDMDKTCFILSNVDFLSITAKACYDILERRTSVVYTLP